MLKVLYFRFQQCFRPFTVLFVEGSSELRLFRHLSNNVFRSPYVQKYMSYEGHSFFWKCSKLNVNFENAKRNSEKVFRLWDNCIGRCWHKFCLWTRESLSSAVNGLTKFLRFCISLRETFSNWIFFRVINIYVKSAVVQISTVFRTVHRVICWRVLWITTF